MNRALPDVSGDWFAAMRRGDWEAAWQATDRLELPRRASHGPAEPEHLRWDGAPFAGRSVLVRCLHGLGDTIQFARFVPLVARVAREVHFLVQPVLLPLLSGVPGLGHVGDGWTDDPPPHEVEIEVMELPYALRLTLETLPPPVSLPVRGAFALPPCEGLKVGLLWAASEWDPSRSLPLDAVRQLLRVEGVCWYGLQQGPAADDDLPLVKLSARTSEIVDAARAMRALDLVISIDGMPAHLAGSLGVPTWVLLKREADWRWMEGRADSPWYPGMRLFRAGAGGWSALLSQVADALAGWRSEAKR